jgi:hypothetical protein
MFRLALKLALAAAAVWAVWTFVPVRGRTLAQRWVAAGDLSTFVERGWAEVAGAEPAKQKAPSRSQARQTPAPRERPTEGHTEADRRAIERILSEHLPDGR